MGTIKVSNQRFCSLYHVTLFCDVALYNIFVLLLNFIRTHSHTYNTNDPMELCKIVNRPINHQATTSCMGLRKKIDPKLSFQVKNQKCPQLPETLRKVVFSRFLENA